MIGIYKITNKINGKCYIGQSINIKQRWKNHKKDAFWKDGPEYQYPLYRAIRKYGIDNFSFEVIEECTTDLLNDKEIYYIALYKSNDNSLGYNQNTGGQLNSHNLKLTDDDVSKIIIRLKTTLDNTRIIAKDFGVGFTTIRGINVGDIYHRNNETYPIRPKMCLLHKTDNGYELKNFQEPTKNRDKNNKSVNVNIKRKRVYFCPNCGEVVATNGCLCVKCSRLAARKAVRPDPLELAKMIKEKGFTQTGKTFGVDGNAIKRWCKDYSIPYLLNDLISWYNEKCGIVEPPKQSKKPIREAKKHIKQIDMMTGEVIKIFDTQIDALRYLGKSEHDSHISEACRGIRKSAHGYFWQYADTENT